MKCATCGRENRRTSKFCSDCGAALSASPSAPQKSRPASAAEAAVSSDADVRFWSPDWKWHARTLLIIYLLLTAAYFGLSRYLSRIPEPHRMRDIPPEMTPWLKR